MMRLQLCAAFIAVTATATPAASAQRDASVGMASSPTLKLTLPAYVLAASGDSLVVTSRTDSDTRVFHTGAIAAITQCGVAVCLGGDKGFFRLEIESAPWSLTALSDLKTNALQTVPGRLMVGTTSGLFEYDLAKRSLQPISQMSDPINALAATESAIFVGTDRGLYELSLSGNVHSSRPRQRFANRVTQIAATNTSVCFISAPEDGLYHLDFPGYPMIQILPPFLATPSRVLFASKDLLMLSNGQIVRWREFPVGELRRERLEDVRDIQLDGVVVNALTAAGIVPLDTALASPERQMSAPANLDKYAMPLYLEGRLSDALAVLRVVVDSPERVAALSATEVPNVFNLLGVVLAAYGENRDAEFAFRRALSVTQDDVSNRFLQAAVLRNLAVSVSATRPDDSEITALLDRALKVGEDPDQHYPEIADGINRLGELAFDVGLDAIALNYYVSALELRKRSHPPTSELIAHSMHNVATVSFRMGDHYRATDLIAKAAAIYRSRLPASAVDYVIALSTLMGAMNKDGRYDVTTSLEQEAATLLALPSVRQQFETDPSINYVPSVVEFDAAIAVVMSSIDKAGLSKLIRSVDDLKGYYGVSTPRFALLIESVAGEYTRMTGDRGDLAAALRRWVSEIGNPDPALLAVLNVAVNGGMTDPSTGFTSFAAESLNRNLDSLLKSATLTERQRVLQTYVPQLTSLILLDNASTADSRSAYAKVSRWKGLWIETARLEARREDMPKDVRRELGIIRSKLGALYSTGLSGERAQTEIGTLLARKDELERRNTAGMLVSTGAETDQVTDLNHLTSLLLEDEALVDIYRVSVGKKIAYKAFVLTKAGEITAIRLGQDDVEQKVQEWFALARSGSDATASWSLLKETVWRPLASSVPSWIRKIAIIPDGVLSSVPWQVFEIENRQHEIAQIDSIYELRELRERHDVVARRGAVVIGDLDYDYGRAGVAVPDDSYFRPLRSARLELAAVARTLQRRETPVTVLSKRNGTKTQFVLHVARAKYIHVVTHGFFNGIQDGVKSVVTLGQTTLAIDENAARDSMAANGLALTGANGRDYLDGRVSAEEILELDLRGAALVVFSACETGSGESNIGQGVLGFRASVMAAGASAVVLSLWRVPDRPTAILMGRFYSNLLNARMPPALALAEAQQWLATSKTFGTQKNWAGWVLVGKGW